MTSVFQDVKGKEKTRSAFTGPVVAGAQPVSCHGLGAALPRAPQAAPCLRSLRADVGVQAVGYLKKTDVPTPLL